LEGGEIIRMVKERKWTKFKIKEQSIYPKISQEYSSTYND